MATPSSVASSSSSSFALAESVARTDLYGDAATLLAQNGSAPPSKRMAYRCTGFGDCNMVFNRSEHLARHVRKHTGDRPFECHCGRKFTRLDNLRQHAAKRHPDDIARNQEMIKHWTLVHSAMQSAVVRSQIDAGMVINAGDRSQGSPSPTTSTFPSSAGLPIGATKRSHNSSTSPRADRGTRSPVRRELTGESSQSLRNTSVTPTSVPLPSLHISRAEYSAPSLPSPSVRSTLSPLGESPLPSPLQTTFSLDVPAPSQSQQAHPQMAQASIASSQPASIYSLYNVPEVYQQQYQSYTAVPPPASSREYQAPSQWWPNFQARAAELYSASDGKQEQPHLTQEPGFSSERRSYVAQEFSSDADLDHSAACSIANSRGVTLPSIAQILPTTTAGRAVNSSECQRSEPISEPGPNSRTINSAVRAQPDTSEVSRSGHSSDTVFSSNPQVHRHEPPVFDNHVKYSGPRASFSLAPTSSSVFEHSAYPALIEREPWHSESMSSASRFFPYPTPPMYPSHDTSSSSNYDNTWSESVSSVILGPQTSTHTSGTLTHEHFYSSPNTHSSSSHHHTWPPVVTSAPCPPVLPPAPVAYDRRHSLAPVHSDPSYADAGHNREMNEHVPAPGTHGAAQRLHAPTLSGPPPPLPSSVDSRPSFDPPYGHVQGGNATHWAPSL